MQGRQNGGSSWIIDSGCTNHMTGEKKMFTSYVKNKDSQDSIIFGDGNQGKVKGLGKIAISSEHSISNVFLVESLLGRRRRRHPSLEAFAVLAAPTMTRQRADLPFASYTAGRRPVTRSSHLATSSRMEARVRSGPL
jgi:hypothetical protein